MRTGLTIFFLVALGLLQYRLWLGDGSIPEVIKIKQAITAESKTNKSLTERNQVLAAEIVDLKTRLDALEERARNQLGMVAEDEVFYQIVIDKE